MTSWLSDKRPWWLWLSVTASLYGHITLHVLHYHHHMNIVTISGSVSSLFFPTGDSVFDHRVLFFELQPSPAAGYFGGEGSFLHHSQIDELV